MLYGALKAALMVMGKDEFCKEYIGALKEGCLEQEPSCKIAARFYTTPAPEEKNEIPIQFRKRSYPGSLTLWDLPGS